VQLTDSPIKIKNMMIRNSVAIIMNVAYGYQVTDEDDRFVRLLEDSLQLNGLLNVPGKFWVESLPFRKSLEDNFWNYSHCIAFFG